MPLLMDDNVEGAEDYSNALKLAVEKCNAKVVAMSSFMNPGNAEASVLIRELSFANLHLAEVCAKLPCHQKGYETASIDET